MKSMHWTSQHSDRWLLLATRAIPACFLLLALLSCVIKTPLLTKTVRTDGADLTYVEAGSGPPVVLVHGALGDWRNWSGQISALSKHYRVLVPSLRGHYPNSPPKSDADISVPAQVRDLITFLEVTKLGPVHLVGHSRGGAPVTIIALQRPDLVRTLVLAEPPLFSLAAADPEVRLWLQAIPEATSSAADLLRTGQREQAMRTFFRHFYGPGGFERLPQALQTEKLDNVVTLGPLAASAGGPPPFTCETSRKLKMPILLVGGELSIRAWRLTLDELSRCLPDAQRATISTGHGMQMENAAAFNQALLPFLAKH